MGHFLKDSSTTYLTYNLQSISSLSCQLLPRSLTSTSFSSSSPCPGTRSSDSCPLIYSHSHSTFICIDFPHWNSPQPSHSNHLYKKKPDLNPLGSVHFFRSDLCLTTDSHRNNPYYRPSTISVIHTFQPVLSIVNSLKCWKEECVGSSISREPEIPHMCCVITAWRIRRDWSARRIKPIYL